MQQEKAPFPPALGLTVGLVAVSFAGTLIKLCHMEPEAMAMFRVIGAGLALLPFALRHMKRELPRLGPKERKLLLLAGLFLAVHFICWMRALRLTTVGSSVMALCTQPVFAAIVGHFFLDERFKVSTAVAIVIAVVGLGLIGLNDIRQEETSALGVVLALFASLFITLCIACGRIVRRQMHILSYSSSIFLIAGILLSPTLFLHAHKIAAYEPMQWFWLGMMVLVPTVMGHTMFYWTIRYFKVITVNLSVLTEPVMASVAAFFILSEIPRPLFCVGAVVILAGVLYHVLSEARENRLRAAPAD